MRKKPIRMATCCLAGTLLVATPVYASPVAGVTEITNNVVENELNTSSPVAGVSLTLAKYLEDNTAGQDADAEAAVDEAAETDNAGEEKQASAKKSKAKTDDTDYAKMAVAKVNDYINIRKKPDENSELVGKLYKDSVATVIKKSGDWYKIQSGSVTGFVKGEYIVVGDEDLVKSVGVKIATVKTTTLKVREKASQKAEVLTLVPGGEELKVTSLENYKDGWVKVAVEGGRGFVSSDYIEISRQYTYAESRQEEEARLAAEEARKQQEEAAKEAEAEAEDTENSTSGSSSSQGGSTASASNSSSQNTSGSSSSQSGSSENSVSESTGSASGQAVANYACQFVGNPYVYGGTSLTNGADCSGFVMSVYAHFGISLPHSSSALRGVGYGVSYENRQPGDIICYSGHVGIYIGNNTIVHASNPASGIKYTSPANYRSVVAVRRIF